MWWNVGWNFGTAGHFKERKATKFLQNLFTKWCKVLRREGGPLRRLKLKQRKTKSSSSALSLLTFQRKVNVKNSCNSLQVEQVLTLPRLFALIGQLWPDYLHYSDNFGPIICIIWTTLAQLFALFGQLWPNYLQLWPALTKVLRTRSDMDFTQSLPAAGRVCG